jgi:hypothetical protein
VESDGDGKCGIQIWASVPQNLNWSYSNPYLWFIPWLFIHFIIFKLNVLSSSTV